MTQKTATTTIDTRGAFKIDTALDKLFGRGSHAKRDWTPKAARTSDQIVFTTIRRRDVQHDAFTAPQR